MDRNYISKENRTTGKSQKEMVVDALCLDLAKNKWSIAGSSGPAKLSKAFLGTQRQVSGKSISVYFKFTLLMYILGQ